MQTFWVCFIFLQTDRKVCLFIYKIILKQKEIKMEKKKITKKEVMDAVKKHQHFFKQRL